MKIRLGPKEERESGGGRAASTDDRSPRLIRADTAMDRGVLPDSAWMHLRDAEQKMVESAAVALVDNKANLVDKWRRNPSWTTSLTETKRTELREASW